MKKNEISDRNKRVAFRQYTKFDLPIVKMASQYGMYLIGGTAIDLMCNKYSVRFWRDRSDNDLDFWTPYTNQNRSKFLEYTRENFGIRVEESSDFMVSLELEKVKIEIDILIDYDSINTKFGSSINGIYVMSPVYLFPSKFDRYINTANVQRRETDLNDLRVLLSIIEKTNGLNELENHLSSQNYDQGAEDMLNSIISSLV